MAKGAIDKPAEDASGALQISIDRDAEVPIGVQLAWALRSRITDGRLSSGMRLPGLRELAESTEVNINTIRSVYQRLEQGEDFAMLAQNFSEDQDSASAGGDLGFIRESALDKASADLRKLMGATNPANAEEGTIRKKWASDIEHNAIHGSDADDTARFELSYFFAGYELAK